MFKRELLNYKLPNSPPLQFYAEPHQRFVIQIIHRLIEVKAATRNSLVATEPKVGIENGKYQPDAFFVVCQCQVDAHQVKCGQLRAEEPQR